MKPKTSKIIKEFGEWAVTEYGIECLSRYYPIEKTRLDAIDWIPHVTQKTWLTRPSDFIKAYEFAKEYFKNNG